MQGRESGGAATKGPWPHVAPPTFQVGSCKEMIRRLCPAAVQTRFNAASSPSLLPEQARQPGYTGMGTGYPSDNHSAAGSLHQFAVASAVVFGNIRLSGCAPVRDQGNDRK